MSGVLLRGGLVVTMDGDRRMLDGGDVLIEGDRLAEVGQVAGERVPPGTEIVDVAGRLVLPGLVNTHVHLSQQLGRGIADDVDLLTWLRARIWPYEGALTLEDSHLSSLACCAELIRSGVTTFAEAGGQEVDGMGRAVEEIGVRAVLVQSTMDCGEGLPAAWVRSTDECLALQQGHLERWHGAADGRIRVWLGLRTLFNCSDELVRRTTALAQERGVGVNMHLAEVADEVDYVRATRGATPVEHMAALGALGPNLLAAHTVWVTPQEVDLFRLHDVKVSHNPAAAMKMLGFAPVPEMLDKGVCVSLGTDGAPSNNRMDLMDEMYLASLVHKGRRLDPTVVPAERVLEMATVNGARAVLWDADVGSLEPGKKADLIVVDPRAPGTLPLHDPISAMVYAMHSSNVVASMCDGRWLLRDGALQTVDEPALLDEVVDRAGSVLRRAGVHVPDRFPVTRLRR